MISRRGFTQECKSVHACNHQPQACLWLAWRTISQWQNHVILPTLLVHVTQQALQLFMVVSIVALLYPSEWTFAQGMQHDGHVHIAEVCIHITCAVHD